MQEKLSMCFLENLIHYQLLEDFGPDLRSIQQIYSTNLTLVKVQLTEANNFPNCTSVFQIKNISSHA